MTQALDTVPGGVISLSSDLRILAANQAMGVLAGRIPEELVGATFDVLLTPPSRILFQTHVYPALKADGRVEEVFLTLASETGDPVPVLMNAVRTSDSASSTYEALLVRILARTRWETDLLDATRSIAAERAASQRLADDLAAAGEDLSVRLAKEKRDSEFRDAFIGVVSHELRTPITTIYGMSHLLSQRLDSMPHETVRLHLNDIAAESDRLRRLTEDLLVLSRAEGGRLLLASDPIPIGHAIENAVDGERARSTGHTLTIEMDRGLPLVSGEDLYIEQVLQNFLSNAAKYSPIGTTIRVVAAPEDGGVAVRVIDEGSGFGDQDPVRLFDLFYRAPDAIQQTAGAGIGLFVCRELIGAMDGRVWAVPAPNGTGSEFGFWLPGLADEPEGT